MSIPHVLANRRAVLGFHQTIVIAVPGPALGLLDRQFAEQLRHRVVHKLASVIGMKAVNGKRKLFQHRRQQRHQPCFANRRRAADHLPLRYFVHGIDVIHALRAIAIPLMHRVHPQVTGPAAGLRPPPFSDRRLRRVGLAEMDTPLTIRHALSQPVNLGHRDRGQPLVFGLPNSLYSRSRMCLVAGPLSVS